MLIVIWLSLMFLWFFGGVVLIGIGTLLLRAFFSAHGLQDAFWAGLAATVAMLELYHFFRPIDLLFVALFAVVGLTGVISQWGALLRQWTMIRQETRWPAPTIVLIGLLVAIRAAGPCEHYDTGLYGSSLVRWTTSFPVVPGLANLHGRFGFNSSVFLCVATLDHSILRGLSYHVFSGLVLLGFVTRVVCACERVLRKNSISFEDGFLLFLLVPTVFWITRAEVVGTMTDLPATISVLVASASLLCGLEGNRNHEERNSSRNLSLAVFLFALAITFKLSMVVMGGLGLTIAFAALARMNLRKGNRKKPLMASALVAALLLVPWIARGLILSGYAFYPNRSLSLNVDWRVPPASADWDGVWVRSWARLPHASLEETQGFRWLVPWWRNVRGDREGFITPVILSIAGCVILIFQKIRHKLLDLPPGLWGLAASIPGLMFWLIEAPALRFGEAALWMTAGMLASNGLRSLPIGTEKRWRVTTTAILVLLGLYCIHPRTLWVESYRVPLSVRNFIPLPKVVVAPQQTDSGLTVFVPLEGNQCWESNLLCTPYFNRSLRQRNSADLRSGFISESSQH